MCKDYKPNNQTQEESGLKKPQKSKKKKRVIFLSLFIFQFFKNKYPSRKSMIKRNQSNLEQNTEYDEKEELIRVLSNNLKQKMEELIMADEFNKKLKLKLKEFQK